MTVVMAPTSGVFGRARHMLVRHLHLALTPLLLAAVILLWWAAVQMFHIDPNLVPPPKAVVRAFVGGFRASPTATDGWYYNMYVTGTETLLGFVAGTCVGIALAILAATNSTIERGIIPFITAFQAVPKIAIAPLFAIWFGLGVSAKVWLAVTIVFFPVFVSALSGFSAVPTESKLLMRAYGATKFQLVRHLVIPWSLPYIFAGLEVALVFSLTAAVVGEFMGGIDGLGSYIMMQQGAVNTPGVFAALAVLGLMGVLLDSLLRLLRRRVLYWVGDASTIGS
ncbi:ABC transporter permease [Streptomyces collinus]